MRVRFWRWLFVLAVRHGEVPLEEMGDRALALRLDSLRRDRPWMMRLVQDGAQAPAGNGAERRLTTEQREKRNPRSP